MSAIAADLFPRRSQIWAWLGPLILVIIMSMGLFASKTKSGGGGGSCTDWINSSSSLPALMALADDCTGVPDGTSLTTYAGATTITSNGTTIDSKTINDCLTISATNVTISKSRILSESSGGCAGSYSVYVNSGSVTIVDSEIDCGGDPPGGFNNSHGIGDGNFTLLRVDIVGCENGITGGGPNWSLTDSYIHDMRQCTQAEGCGDPDGSHTDGIQTYPGGDHYTVTDSLIVSMKAGASANEADGAYYTTSAIITYPTDHDATVEGNVFAGGAFTVYCPEDAVNWQLNNNKFSRYYKSSVGSFGHTDACVGLGTGNTYLETGLPLTLE